MSKCQDDTYLDEQIPTQEILQKGKTDKEKSKKKIKYKGLIVNHRFNSSENELKEKHTKKYLRKLYNKLRKKHKKQTNTSSSLKVELIDLELPGPNAILEASKIVLNEFPYEKIENYNLVGLQEQNSLDVNMVTFDFDSFTEEDIYQNNEIIDEYYSQNLDYMILLEIANNPLIYNHLDDNEQAKSSSEFWIFVCTISKAVLNGYGYSRSVISYVLAGDRSKTSSTNYYNGFSSSDSRRDAYRHILWNSLLAQYYFTISSKSPRVNFAKLVTNARESSPCGNYNAVDSRQMDYHNNSIGRKIWSDNTSYRTFWGWNVGLRKPSTSRLKDLAYDKVEKQSCFVVAAKYLDLNIRSLHYTENESASKILNIDNNTAVYIKGAIANKIYRTQTTYDYSNCNDNLDPIEIGLENVRISEYEEGMYDCPRITYTTRAINACFVSKDPNYNPY